MIKLSYDLNFAENIFFSQNETQKLTFKKKACTSVMRAANFATTQYIRLNFLCADEKPINSINKGESQLPTFRDIHKQF